MIVGYKNYISMIVLGSSFVWNISSKVNTSALYIMSSGCVFTSKVLEGLLDRLFLALNFDNEADVAFFTGLNKYIC